MSNGTFHLITMLLVALPVCVLVTGKAGGPWWMPNITREHTPGMYWLTVVLQVAVLIAFVTTGRMWDPR